MNEDYFLYEAAENTKPEMWPSKPYDNVDNPVSTPKAMNPQKMMPKITEPKEPNLLEPVNNTRSQTSGDGSGTGAQAVKNSYLNIFGEDLGHHDEWFERKENEEPEVALIPTDKK